MTQRNYTTLLTSITTDDGYVSDWEIEFGDWDEQAVVEEQESLLDNYDRDVPSVVLNTLLVTTDGTQAAIDKAVEGLNERPGVKYADDEGIIEV